MLWVVPQITHRSPFIQLNERYFMPLAGLTISLTLILLLNLVQTPHKYPIKSQIFKFFPKIPLSFLK